VSKESHGSGPEAVEFTKFPWRGEPALRRVHALNARCLEVMILLARGERELIALPIIDGQRGLWRGLNESARTLAARTPFLLMDVHFQDAEWWRWARDSRNNRQRKIVLRAAFAAKTADELMRETLMLAWSTVALDRGAATLLLGMTPAVISTIAELDPQDVERIAARHSRHLRPRWEDFPAFWCKLLTAAKDGDEAALHETHLHGIQLLGSELLPLLDGRSI
jgi:hypothetical protein